MSNNQAQDAYNPDRIGSEFEEHIFDELNEGEIFRMSTNNNDSQYRKEHEREAYSLKEMRLILIQRRQKVFTKI